MLNHDAIAARIPHQGGMCLLAGVRAWTPELIRCRADSHRRPDNPLRADGRLGIAGGVEYAAQAMAVHGSLLAGSPGRPRQGLLASVRAVEFAADRLDDIAGDLEIEAVRISGDGNNVVYEFVLRAGDRRLLGGRATVILDAEVQP